MPTPLRKLTALGVHIFAGGFTVGVRRAGFDVLAHLEDSSYGVDSALANWPDLDVRVGEASWRLKDFVGEVDFVYSNPPCAIFSSAGISTTRGKDAWREDPRLGCWHRAMTVFKTVRPRAFALESVCQAYTKGREVVDEFTEAAVGLGYSVTHLMVNASRLGSPQARKRFFFVAVDAKYDLQFRVEDAPTVTVANALKEAVGVGHVNDHCKSPTNGRKYRSCIVETAPGGKLSDTYDRLGYGTVKGPRGNVIGRPGFMYQRLDEEKTMGAFTGDFFVHPSEDRFLGTQEMKALCGYPQDFKLMGPPQGHASLLARAVMPPVGWWLARSIREALRGGTSTSSPTIEFVDLRKPSRGDEDA